MLLDERKAECCCLEDSVMLGTTRYILTLPRQTAFLTLSRHVLGEAAFQDSCCTDYANFKVRYEVEVLLSLGTDTTPTYDVAPEDVVHNHYEGSFSVKQLPYPP